MYNTNAFYLITPIIIQIVQNSNEIVGDSDTNKIQRGDRHKVLLSSLVKVAALVLVNIITILKHCNWLCGGI